MGFLGFNWRSLHFKIVLSSVLIEAIMLSALVWNSTRIAEERLIIQAQYWLEGIAPVLNAAIAPALFREDSASLKELLDNIIAQGEISYAAIYDAQNGQIYATDTRPISPQINPPLSFTAHIQQMGLKVPYLIQIPIASDGYQLGRLEMKYNTQFIQDASEDIRDQGILIAILEISISILLLVLLGVAITQKLYLLTRAAQQMSQGDLSVRANIPGQDEVSSTANAFNKMATVISEKTQDLERAIKEQRNSQARLHAIVENAGDAIMTIDEHGIITSFNTAAIHLFDYQNQEVLGENIAFLMPKAQRDEYNLYLKQQLDTALEQGKGKEIKIQHKDTHLIPVWVSIGIFNALGKNNFSGHFS